MIRLPQNLGRKIMTLMIVFNAVLSFAAAPVLADLSTFQQDCSTNGVSETCTPPNISDFQGLVTKIIATAWSLGAVIFFVILLYNGTIYLIGSWEESKYILGASLEDVQKRMSQWGIGFFMFFLSYPLMNTMLKALVANTNCYAELRQPGFTFFFPTLCQEVDFTQYATLIKINPSPIPPNKDLPLPCSTPRTLATVDNSTSYDPFCSLNCGTKYNTYTEFLDTPNSKYVLCSCNDKACYGTSITPY